MLSRRNDQKTQILKYWLLSTILLIPEGVFAQSEGKQITLSGVKLYGKLSAVIENCLSHQQPGYSKKLEAEFKSFRDVLVWKYVKDGGSDRGFSDAYLAGYYDAYANIGSPSWGDSAADSNCQTDLKTVKETMSWLRQSYSK